MKDQIPTGPYVIRNKQTSTVIHVDNPNTSNASLNKKWSVVACEQNESRYPEQQVWWVEPSPTSGVVDDGEATTYSITNCATGRCLDANLGGANAYFMPRHEATKGEWRLVAYQNRGAPWQKWRIENVSDDKDEPYYRIVNVWNNELLSIARSGAESGESGPRCNIGKSEATPIKTWEFIVPIVAFPPGWCRIQNCETLGLLSQSYLSNPPVLVGSAAAAAPQAQRQPQFRESWAEQWVLAHTSYLFPDFKIITGANTWCVRNRLTGGYLGCVYSDRYPFIGGQAVSANDWDLTEDDIAAHAWKLEIDPSCAMNWKLIHHKTGFLLERGAGMVHGGVEVQCKDKRFARGNKHKTWTLISPVVESAEGEAPPEYEIQPQQSTVTAPRGGLGDFATRAGR